MISIATFNVNSIKARLLNLLAWLDEAKPDIVLLQELKCVDEAFPAMEIEERGYNLAIHGQKTYNGVAILSDKPLNVIAKNLSGNDDDTQARYLEADYDGIRLINIYLPNGNPVESEKFPYKLAWMERLVSRVKTLRDERIPFLIGGDFNVIPSAIDCYDPDAWRGDALFHPETLKQYRKLLALGLTDALRVSTSAPHSYTFWDYQAGAWPRDNGIRIDHFLLSPPIADRLMSCSIDKEPRGWEKASDHTPIWISLS